LTLEAEPISKARILPLTLFDSHPKWIVITLMFRSDYQYFMGL
jgi:hypothetical protein